MDWASCWQLEAHSQSFVDTLSRSFTLISVRLSDPVFSNDNVTFVVREYDTSVQLA